MNQKLTMQELFEAHTHGLLSNFDRYNEQLIAHVFNVQLGIWELVDLNYDDAQPPELKLIWRFRCAHWNPIIFWNALDPVNQKILERHAGVSELRHLLHFFVWLINGRKIPGYRDTQSIVEAYYNDTTTNRLELIKIYNDEIDSRLIKNEINQIISRLEVVLDENKLSTEKHEVLVKIIKDLSEIN